MLALTYSQVHAKVQDNSTDWGGWSTEKPTGEATVSGQPAEMDTWADKGAKMDSDAGDDNWEKKSSTPEASNKNDPWGKSERCLKQYVECNNRKLTWKDV